MTEQLQSRFRAMSDEEMNDLGAQYASLTDEAQTLVRAEFARRHLEIPELKEEGEPDALLGIRTIRQYRDQAEAIMARSALASAGISCYLRDENTIRMDWLWSNLMGGIRLQVAEADVESAEAVLSQPIPEIIALADETDYQQPKCPRCGSLDCNFNTHDLKVATASLYLTGIPLPFVRPQDFWRCNECGTSWIDEGGTRIVQADE